MKKIGIMPLAGLIGACNNGSGSTEGSSNTMDRPRDINEAITDSTRLINDSVLVPGTNDQGSTSKNDRSGRKID